MTSGDAAAAPEGAVGEGGTSWQLFGLKSSVFFPTMGVSVSSETKEVTR